ncbi:hypothetical protein [uncultured Psychrobacter sp.]|uniref:hypothetical protein n=1 Tax=uncultured Psychrobacter sp. TaxID=259303 RepID=UPI0030DD3D1E
MKLYSIDNKPLTPKARAKVDLMLLEATKELKKALINARGIHTKAAEGWRVDTGAYGENTYRELSVRHYGAWRDEAYCDASDEEWHQAYTIEDNDHMVLSEESYDAIKAVVGKVAKRYKKLDIDFDEAEKCWLIFDIRVRNPNKPAA